MPRSGNIEPTWPQVEGARVDEYAAGDSPDQQPQPPSNPPSTTPGGGRYDNPGGAGGGGGSHNHGTQINFQ